MHTKKLKARFTIELDVIEDEFKYNEGTWCANNLIEMLIEEAERREKDGEPCLCPIIKVEII